MFLFLISQVENNYLKHYMLGTYKIKIKNLGPSLPFVMFLQYFDRHIREIVLARGGHTLTHKFWKLLKQIFSIAMFKEVVPTSC